MSRLKIIAAVVLLLATNAVSYYVGFNNNDTKNYEAACLQADFIRSLMDWDFNQTGPSIGAEIEESYYEWFQDLELGNYKTKKLKDIRQLEEYHWCY